MAGGLLSSSFGTAGTGARVAFFVAYEAERAGATRSAATAAFFASPEAPRMEAAVLVDATEATEAGRARDATDATEGGRLVPAAFDPVALMD